MKSLKCLLLAGIAAIGFVSCSKDGENGTGSPLGDIKGVDLRDEMGASMGVVGTPDVHFKSDSFFLTIFPNPSKTVMAAFLRVDNSTPITLDVSLIAASYRDAPPAAVIENSNIIGSKVWSSEIPLNIAPEPEPNPGGIEPGDDKVMTYGQIVQFNIDVSPLPQGFYRLQVSDRADNIYWQNVWIAK